MSGYWIDVSNSRGWTSVATSYTGQYGIASNNEDNNLYISNNYGVNWSIATGSAPTSAGWGSVAISEDGVLMAACQGQGTVGDIYNVYLFKNGNWQNITTGTGNNPGNNTTWQSVYISVDNNTLVACDGSSTLWLYNILTNVWTICPISNTRDQVRASIVSGNIYGFISISTNNWINTIYGNNISGYTATTIDATKSNINDFLPHNPAWTWISASRNGLKMVICSSGPNYIYTGSVDNSGYWTFVKETAAGEGEWKRVQFGPDEETIIACSSNYGDNSISGTIWLGNYNQSSKTYDWSQQKDANGNNLLGDWFSISRSLDNSKLTKFIAVTKYSTPTEKSGIWIYTSYKTALETAQPASQIACFNKDSNILTNKGYVPVQNLKKGDLVKTINHGYVPIFMIGKKEIYHPANPEKIKNQLYRCSTTKYLELTEDLILTGCHCILVDNFKDEIQRKKTKEVNNDIYVTDSKLRLPVCVDDNTTIYETPGTYTIYHFALENEDYYMNYGVFANGLLVETCSKRYIKECTDMEFYE